MVFKSPSTAEPIFQVNHMQTYMWQNGKAVILTAGITLIRKGHTVDPNYLPIPYFLIHLLANMFVTPKSICVMFSCHSHLYSSKKSCHLMPMFPSEVERGDILPSSFGSYTVQKCPFWGLFSATIFLHLYAFFLLLEILLYKVVPKHSAAVGTILFLRKRLWHALFRHGLSCCWLCVWSLMNQW